MVLLTKFFEKNKYISRTNLLSCCPCVFRSKKQNSVEPDTWGTPVLAVTIIADDALIRTKSPTPTHFSLDKFSISQDSGINQQTSSSGSESSEYCTPPAEPYLPLPKSDIVSKSKNVREQNTDQSDNSSDTPRTSSGQHQLPEPPPRERFINLEEDHESTSDFDENEEEKKNSDIDDTDFVRSQVYQKLHDEHIIDSAKDPPFREKISEKRLSKSHADLSDVKKFTRKTINSAPLVKHLQAIENGFDSKFNGSTVDEESRVSLNGSSIDLRNSLRNSQENQSQIELRSISSSHGNLSQFEYNTNKSLTDLRSSPFESRSQSQKDLRSSQLDLRSINDSQTNLQFPEEEQEEKVAVKYPEIIRKKSLPAKPKIELKRRPSIIPAKNMAIFPETLRNFQKPKEGFSEVISQLESPEWEQSMKGIQGLVRLTRHHQDMVEAQLHNVCVLLGRHIKNLRSQVARSACLAASEMLKIHKRTLEVDIEELAIPLLQRTADTNKFLRADANAALDSMCQNISTSRAVNVLALRGATHHNAVVRCVTCRLLNEIVHRHGANRIYQMPREIRDKILFVGANMLMEGSLDTRKHAKSMFLELTNHPQFNRAISEAVPPTTLRNITKQLNNLK